MSDTFKCNFCKGTFSKGSEELANEEALINFGIEKASERDDMAIVCDECYKVIIGVGR
jgi:hypothetical protein